MRKHFAVLDQSLEAFVSKQTDHFDSHEAERWRRLGSIIGRTKDDALGNRDMYFLEDMSRRGHNLEKTPEFVMRYSAFYYGICQEIKAAHDKLNAGRKKSRKKSRKKKAKILLDFSD